MNHPPRAAAAPRTTRTNLRRCFRRRPRPQHILPSVLALVVIAGTTEARGDVSADDAAPATTAPAPAASTGHWPQFRGPTQDLISNERNLLDTWPADGPTLLWQSPHAGSGYSTVSVAGGRVYTQGHFDADERIVALDEATGTLIWSVTVGPAVAVNLPGSRAVPTIEGNRLYVTTVGGDIACLDTNEGREIWRRHLHRDFSGRMGDFGFSASPVIAGDLLLCLPDGETSTIVALDKGTGQLRWTGLAPSDEPRSYATPLAIEVGGMPQIVAFTAAGVVGFDGTDGTLLWQESRSSNHGANCTTPVYRDGLLFSSSSYGAGAALIRLTAESGTTTSSLVYHTQRMKNHHGGFVLVDGHIYGANESIWTCLELRSGNVVWKERGVGKGSVVYAEGHLYLRGESGEMALIRATPDGYVESGRFTPPHRSDKSAWAYPVVAGGRLFLRDQAVLLAYDVRKPAAP